MKAKFVSLMLASSALLFTACGKSMDPGTPEERSELKSQTQSSLGEMTKVDPTLQQQIDTSYAYAIFPKVTAAGVGVGGAHGKGEVFKGGQLTGYADMTQANVGIQLGGQSYTELILFRNEGTYRNFIGGTFEFDARAGAVVAASGSAASADYSKGVAVFTLPLGGAMFQAAVGGQKFRYTPITAVKDTTTTTR